MQNTQARRHQLLALLVVVLTLGVVSVQAQQYTALYLFGTNSGDPTNPAWMGLFTQGRDGNLYSTTQVGGENGFGAIFQLTPAGKMTTLYNFANKDDGAYPNSGLTLGTDGNLYGTTPAGTQSVYGAVFKISPSGKFTVLHHFNGSTEGAPPNAPPIQGLDGNFYGTTSNGGNAVF